MKKMIPARLAAVAGLALMSVGAVADGPYHRGPVFEVTITNLTRGQVFSPPLVVTHPGSIALFQAGQPASDELAALAEDGDTGPLVGALEGEHGVRTAVGEGPIPPGQSATIRISARNFRSEISVAAMLVSTNDAFMAVNGADLPRSRHRPLNVRPIAYDAGSEDNDESCAYIPGPPCGNPFQSSDVPGEGYVHVHNGIHGVGDLNPSVNDWRNPVAAVSVRRVRR